MEKKIVRNHIISLFAGKMDKIVKILENDKDVLGLLEYESYGGKFYETAGILEVRNPEERLKKLIELAEEIVSKIERGEDVSEYSTAFSIIPRELEERIKQSDEQFHYENRTESNLTIESLYDDYSHDLERRETKFQKYKSNPKEYRYLKEAAVQLILERRSKDPKKYLADVPPYLTSYEQITEYLKSNNSKMKKADKEAMIEEFDSDIDELIKEDIIPQYSPEMPYFGSARRIVRYARDIEDLISFYKYKELDRKIQQKNITGRTQVKLSTVNVKQYLESEFGIPIRQIIPTAYINDYLKFEQEVMARQYEILTLVTTMREMEECFGKEKLTSDQEILLYRAGLYTEKGMTSKNPDGIAVETDHIGEGSSIDTSFLSATESPIVLAKYLSEFKKKNGYQTTPVIIDCKKIYQLLGERLEELEAPSEATSLNLNYTFEHEESVLKSMLEKTKNLTDEQRKKIEDRLLKIKTLEKYTTREDLPTSFFDTRRGFSAQTTSDGLKIMNPEISRILENVRSVKEQAEENAEGYPFLESSTREKTDTAIDKRNEVVGRRIAIYSNADFEFLFQTALPSESLRPIEPMALDLIEAAVSRKNNIAYPELKNEIVLGILHGKIDFAKSLRTVFENDDMLDRLKDEGGFDIEELDFIREYYVEGKNIKEYMADTFKNPTKSNDKVITYEHDRRKEALAKLLKTETFTNILKENLPESVHSDIDSFGKEKDIEVAYHASKTSTDYIGKDIITHTIIPEVRKSYAVDLHYERKYPGKMELKPEIASELNSGTATSAATRLRRIREIKNAEIAKKQQRQAKKEANKETKKDVKKDDTTIQH